MRYDILIMPEAAEHFRRMQSVERRAIESAIQAHLRFEPKKESKSRIKRLRGMEQPQYRLRIGEFRVFYDGVEAEVQVLAALSKSEAYSWLERQGRKS